MCAHLCEGNELAKRGFILLVILRSCLSTSRHEGECAPERPRTFNPVQPNAELAAARRDKKFCRYCKRDTAIQPDFSAETLRVGQLQLGIVTRQYGEK
jgi:hypothetical protein